MTPGTATLTTATRKTYTLHINAKDTNPDGSEYEEIQQVRCDLPYLVKVYKVYIPGKDYLTGEDCSIPTWIRKGHFVGVGINNSGHFRMSCSVKRTKDEKAIVRITVSVLERIQQSHWTNPSGERKPWYKLGNRFMRVDNIQYTAEQFQQWLIGHLGPIDASDAVAQLTEGVYEGMPMPRKKRPPLTEEQLALKERQERVDRDLKRGVITEEQYGKLHAVIKAERKSHSNKAKAAVEAAKPKCACGRPLWTPSPTKQCFPCTPSRYK